MENNRFAGLVEYIEKGIGIISCTGIRVAECRDRYVKLMMPIEKNKNHIGIMYAGSLFIIGEVSGGAIFGTSFDYTRYYPVAKEVSIRFRRPALSDVSLEVEMSEERVTEIQGRVEEEGKADFRLDLEINDISGETVSLIQGTWQLRKIPEGMTVPWL